MTAKDYEIIARAISRARARHAAAQDRTGEFDDGGIDTVVDQLCIDLREQNPRFDPVRLREACA